MKDKERFIVYDIETLNVDVTNKNEKGFLQFTGNEQIVSIAFIGSNDKKDCYILDGERFETEEQLLQEFCSLLKDYELIIGFNNHGFDDPVMLDRLKRVGNRENNLTTFVKYFSFKYKNSLDVMKLAKLLGYSGNYISLNDLCSVLGLEDSKDDVNPVTTYKQKKYNVLKEYNLKDVELTLQCLNSMEGLSVVDELMELTGCKSRDVFSNVAMLNNYIKKNNIEKVNQRKLEGKNLGGFNYYKDSKELERYYDLNHFDVKSMYPSIMILIQADSGYNYPGFNIDDLTLKPFTDDDLNDGVVGKIAKDLFDKRSSVKKEMKNKTKGSYEYDKLDHKQKTYKILVNSLYGALDSNTKNVFFLKNSKLASLITFLGRDILTACIERFDGVYGKTDSIWVDCNISLEEVNEFVSDYLMSAYNLDNKDGIVSFEHDHTDNDGNPLIVKELIVKDKNNYVEILENNNVNKKGSSFIDSTNSRFESDIIHKFIIRNENITNLNKFIKESLKKPLDYFSKKVKLSSKQKHHEKLNTLWMDYNDIPYEWDYKYNSVYSEAGWVLFDKQVPKIPISKEYAKYLADKLLYSLKMLEKEPSKDFTKHLPLVPCAYDEKDRRFKFDVKRICKYLDIDKKILYNRPNHSISFYTKWDLTHVKTDLFGLLCHEKTGFICVDIDDDVDYWFEKLSQEFPIKRYTWTNTRSSKYHLILKTKDLDCFNNIRLKGNAVEWKKNALVPFNINIKDNNYNLLEDTASLNSMKNISYNVLTKKLDIIGLLNNEELPKITNKIITEPLKDVKDSTIDNVVEMIVKLEKLRREKKEVYLDNQSDDSYPTISSNDLFMGIGNMLKSNLSIEDCLKVVGRLLQVDLSDFDSYFTKGESIEREKIMKIKSTVQNGEMENLRSIASCIKKYSEHRNDDRYKSLYSYLKTVEGEFEDLFADDYIDIFGAEPFEFNTMLADTFQEYTDKYDEIMYYVLMLMSMIIYDQYRIVELTDFANTGKTFYVKICRKITPKKLQKLSNISTITESTFRQLCNYYSGDPLDESVMFITDTPKSKILEWENIFDLLKPIMTQDNREIDGVYEFPKSKQGGSGIQNDIIYSMHGLLILIANPDGFSHNHQNERRSSILKLPNTDDETYLKRNSDENPLVYDKNKVNNLLENINKYMISLMRLNKKDIPKIIIPDKHVRKMIELDRDSILYYKKLYTCMCFLENREDLDDYNFKRFLRITQLSITNNLNSIELNLLKKLMYYFVPVSPSTFDGYDDDYKLEIKEKEPFKKGKGNNRLFTTANVKSSIGQSKDYNEKNLGNILEKLADDDNNYIIRFCKNRKNNWIYYLNADAIDKI